MEALDGMTIFCFSHLRWNFVYQRPQHLMTRLSKKNRVFFVEEPHFDNGSFYDVIKQDEKLWIVVPHLTHGMSTEEIIEHEREFLSRLLIKMHIEDYLVWYYTPMALQISDHFKPLLTIYDCMDELSAFKFAPPSLVELESKLFNKADIVFTGGHRLYETKKSLHNNIYAFPSSIDFNHFVQARTISTEHEGHRVTMVRRDSVR